MAIFILTFWTRADAQVFSYEPLMSEVAKMACQIPPEDRNRVAVMEPVVDRRELQDCIGRSLAEVVIQVLWEFQFALIENEPLPGKFTGDSPRLDRDTVSEIGRRAGARSICIGTVDIDHDTIHVAYRMMRLETMEIIRVVSCILSKKEFANCFLLDDLTSPTVGAIILLPEPRRLR
jgi:hypothetical protein